MKETFDLEYNEISQPTNNHSCVFYNFNYPLEVNNLIKKIYAKDIPEFMKKRIVDVLRTLYTRYEEFQLEMYLTDTSLEVEKNNEIIFSIFLKDNKIFYKHYDLYINGYLEEYEIINLLGEVEEKVVRTHKDTNYKIYNTNIYYKENNEFVKRRKFSKDYIDGIHYNRKSIYLFPNSSKTYDKLIPIEKDKEIRYWPQSITEQDYNKLDEDIKPQLSFENLNGYISSNIKFKNEINIYLRKYLKELEYLNIPIKDQNNLIKMIYEVLNIDDCKILLDSNKLIIKNINSEYKFILNANNIILKYLDHKNKKDRYNQADKTWSYRKINDELRIYEFFTLDKIHYIEQNRTYKNNRLINQFFNQSGDYIYQILFNSSSDALIRYMSPNNLLKCYFVPKLRLEKDRLGNNNYLYDQYYYLEEIDEEKYEEILNNHLVKKRKLFKK